MSEEQDTVFAYNSVTVKKLLLASHRSNIRRGGEQKKPVIHKSTKQTKGSPWNLGTRKKSESTRRELQNNDAMGASPRQDGCSGCSDPLRNQMHPTGLLLNLACSCRQAILSTRLGAPGWFPCRACVPSCAFQGPKAAAEKIGVCLVSNEPKFNHPVSKTQVNSGQALCMTTPHLRLRGMRGVYLAVMPQV